MGSQSENTPARATRLLPWTSPGSCDWAHDGGIYRPVQLLVTPKTFVERVDIEAIPNFTNNEGNLTISAYARNASSKRWSGRASFQVFDEETGLVVLTKSEPSG